MVVAVFLTANFSCKKDFLNVVDKTVLLKEGYVKDLETTGHFLNGIYLDLAVYCFSSNYAGHAEFTGDNFKPTGQHYLVLYNWEYTPVNEGHSFGNFKVLWNMYYNVIRNCSFVIEKANEFRDQNPSEANDFKGQALAIRALLHFYLVNMFAQSYNFTPDASHLGVPLIRTSDTQVPVSRQKVSEVYAGILEDIQQALEILPRTVNTRMLMNYQAAQALLARIYLFKEDYANSKNAATQVLNEVPLMISGYPDKLYATEESEALFRLPPGGDVGLFPTYIGREARRSTPRLLATNDIAQLLLADPNDKRKIWVTQIPMGWRVTKFPRSAAGGLSTLPDSDYFQTIFRSTEMALTAAESYSKLNMYDSARYFIDLIRLRANPTLSNISATGAALLDSIYIERRKELCFDGLRMFDLQRWKKDVYRMDALTPQVQHLPYPNNKAIAPIPQQDIDLSGLVQNPGY